MTTGLCLWCENPDTAINADGLCVMCAETGQGDEYVTPAMKEAWVDFEPADGFSLDGGYNQAVALVRHAFMSGYSAASADVESAIRDHERANGPCGDAWNISSILNCLRNAA